MHSYSNMKKRLFFLAFTLSFITIYCQDIDNIHTNAVQNHTYFSFGGAGVYYSLIYERQLIYRNSYSAGVKAGIGTDFSPASFPDEFNIPVGGYFLYGKRNSHLDVSFCFTNYFLQQYDYDDDRNYNEYKLLLVPSIAYRYQKNSGGFLARIGFSTVFYFNDVSNTVSPWIDVSLGWSF